MNRNSISQAILPIAYIVTGLFIGVSMQAHSDSRKVRTQDVVRAHKIELVDNKERVRMVLDTFSTKDEDDGKAFQAFKSQDNHTYLTLGFPGLLLGGTEAGNMGLGIRPEDGHPIVITTSKSGEVSTYDLTKIKN